MQVAEEIMLKKLTAQDVEIIDQMLSLCDQLKQYYWDRQNKQAELVELLFRLSWRSSELPWRVRDGEAEKMLLPWHDLEWLAYALNQHSDMPVEAMISEEDIKSLQESLQRLKNRQHVQQAMCYPQLEQFVASATDIFHVQAMQQAIERIEENAGLIAQHPELRPALLRVIEVIGEHAKNLSDAYKQAHAHVRWEDFILLRNKLQHPEKYRMTAQHVQAMLTDPDQANANNIIVALVHVKPSLTESKPRATNSREIDNVASLTALFTPSMPVQSIALNQLLAQVDNRRKTSLDNLVRYLSDTVSESKNGSLIEGMLREIAPDLSTRKMNAFCKEVKSREVACFKTLVEKAVADTKFCSKQIKKFLGDRPIQPLSVAKLIARMRAINSCNENLLGKFESFFEELFLAEDVAVNLSRLSVSPEAQRLIDHINQSIDAIIELQRNYRNSSMQNQDTARLATEYHLERVGDQVKKLRECQEFKPHAQGSGILSHQLEALVSLRKMLAHRQHELALTVLNSNLDTLSKMRIDLEMVRQKIESPEPPTAAMDGPATPCSSLSRQELWDKVDAIMGLHAMFNVSYANTALIGKLVPNIANLGVTCALDLLIKPNDPNLFMDQVEFESALSQLLSTTVRTYTEQQLHAMVGNKLTLVHCEQVVAGAANLVVCFRSIHHQQEVAAGRRPAGPMGFAAGPWLVSHQEMLDYDHKKAEEARASLTDPLVNKVLDELAIDIYEQEAAAVQFFAAYQVPLEQLQGYVSKLKACNDAEAHRTKVVNTILNTMYAERYIGDASIKLECKESAPEQLPRFFYSRLDAKRKLLNDSPGILRGVLSHDQYTDYARACQQRKELAKACEALEGDITDKVSAEAEARKVDNFDLADLARRVISNRETLAVLATFVQGEQIFSFVHNKQRLAAINLIYPALQQRYLDPNALSPIIRLTQHANGVECGQGLLHEEVDQRKQKKQEAWTKNAQQEFMQKIELRQQQAKHITPILRQIYEGLVPKEASEPNLSDPFTWFKQHVVEFSKRSLEMEKISHYRTRGRVLVVQMKKCEKYIALSTQLGLLNRESLIAMYQQSYQTYRQQSSDIVLELSAILLENILLKGNMYEYLVSNAHYAFEIVSSHIEQVETEQGVLTSQQQDAMEQKALCQFLLRNYPFEAGQTASKRPAEAELPTGKRSRGAGSDEENTSPDSPHAGSAAAPAPKIARRQSFSGAILRERDKHNIHSSPAL
jgi:uncharacterized protein with HEPN domain